MAIRQALGWKYKSPHSSVAPISLSEVLPTAPSDLWCLFLLGLWFCLCVVTLHPGQMPSHPEPSDSAPQSSPPGPALLPLLPHPPCDSVIDRGACLCEECLTGQREDNSPSFARVSQVPGTEMAHSSCMFTCVECTHVPVWSRGPWGAAVLSPHKRTTPGRAHPHPSISHFTCGPDLVPLLKIMTSLSAGITFSSPVSSPFSWWPGMSSSSKSTVKDTYYPHILLIIHVVKHSKECCSAAGIMPFPRLR